MAYLSSSENRYCMTVGKYKIIFAKIEKLAKGEQ